MYENDYPKNQHKSTAQNNLLKQYNMNLNEICGSISEWNSLRESSQAQKIIALFEQGNNFSYKNENQGIVPSDSYLHAYPGVGSDGKLKIFLIEASRDTLEQHESKEGLLPFITQCHLNHSANLGDEIPDQEALARIQDWKENYPEWIAQQVTQPDNIFQAFAIPLSDVAEGHSLKIYFALKSENSGSQATADLIVYDASPEGKTGNLAKYFDMVRPVPPFHVDTPLDEENFFLLEIS